MAGFGEQLQAAAPMFLGIGSQLSGRDPVGIARGMALMSAKQESDKRKAAINNMLSGMGIAGPEKAFLESMPPEAQQQWILQQMAPQEPVRGVQMGDRLVNPITGQVIADYSTPVQPFPWPNEGGGGNYNVGGNVRMQGVSDPAMQAWNTFASGWSGPELNVTSAYRDPNYNSRVGGAKNSQHTHGNAFDFSTSGWTQEQKQAAVQRALDAGFTGVGVYGDSLHFDTGPRRVWGPSYGKESAPEWVTAMVMGGGSAAPRPQTSAQSSNIDTQIASYTKAIDVYDRALAANLGSPSERKVAEDKRDRLIKMRDEAIKRQQEAVQAAKPQIVKGADGYNYWVAPGQTPQRVIEGIEGEPDDEYGRYVEEEVKAGRQPLSRIDFKRAGQKSMRIRTSPDGSAVVEEIFGGDGAPDLTVDAAKNTGFLIRTKAANTILDQFDRQGTDFWQTLANDKGGRLGNYALTPEFQKFDQAKRDFVNAILRRESGAVISDEEFANANKQYFPVPGDSDEVIAQKRQNRRTAIEGLRVGSGAGAAYIDGKSTDGAGGEGLQVQTDQAVDLQGADLELFGKYGVPIEQ